MCVHGDLVIAQGNNLGGATYHVEHILMHIDATVDMWTKQRGGWYHIGWIWWQWALAVALGNIFDLFKLHVQRPTMVEVGGGLKQYKMLFFWVLQNLWDQP